MLSSHSKLYRRVSPDVQEHLLAVTTRLRGLVTDQRELRRITERIEGKTSAMESPYGLVPVHGAIDYQAAGVSDEDWDALFAIDAAALSAEADDTDVFQLVLPAEAKALGDTCSVECPLGKALVATHIGETRRYMTESGRSMAITVLAVDSVNPNATAGR